MQIPDERVARARVGRTSHLGPSGMGMGIRWNGGPHTCVVCGHERGPHLQAGLESSSCCCTSRNIPTVDACGSGVCRYRAAWDAPAATCRNRGWPPSCFLGVPQASVSFSLTTFHLFSHTLGSCSRSSRLTHPTTLFSRNRRARTSWCHTRWPISPSSASILATQAPCHMYLSIRYLACCRRGTSTTYAGLVPGQLINSSGANAMHSFDHDTTLSLPDQGNPSDRSAPRPRPVLEVRLDMGSRYRRGNAPQGAQARLSSRSSDQRPRRPAWVPMATPCTPWTPLVRQTLGRRQEEYQARDWQESTLIPPHRDAPGSHWRTAPVTGWLTLIRRAHWQVASHCAVKSPTTSDGETPCLSYQTLVVAHHRRLPGQLGQVPR